MVFFLKHFYLIIFSHLLNQDPLQVFFRFFLLVLYILPLFTPYTLLLLGGLQPLCGNGVTSFNQVTLTPFIAPTDLTAVSLPDPGPLILIPTFLIPCSIAFAIASSTAA